MLQIDSVRVLLMLAFFIACLSIKCQWSVHAMAACGKCRLYARKIVVSYTNCWREPVNPSFHTAAVGLSVVMVEYWECCVLSQMNFFGDLIEWTDRCFYRAETCFGVHYVMILLFFTNFSLTPFYFCTGNSFLDCCVITCISLVTISLVWHTVLCCWTAEWFICVVLNTAIEWNCVLLVYEFVCVTVTFLI